jgi:hypothetical protein
LIPPIRAYLIHKCSERAEGRANNAATIHTPQIVAPVARHVGCEETRTWRGFTITLYLWMLSTATEYASRPNDRRLQNTMNVIIKTEYMNEKYITIWRRKAKTKKSLITKLMMYILGNNFRQRFKLGRSS